MRVISPSRICSSTIQIDEVVLDAVVGGGSFLRLVPVRADSFSRPGTGAHQDRSVVNSSI
jgi:hypothetical protein